MGLAHTPSLNCLITFSNGIYWKGAPVTRVDVPALLYVTPSGILNEIPLYIFHLCVFQYQANIEVITTS